MTINQSDLDQCISDEYKNRYQNEIFNSCSDDFSPAWFPRCCDHHVALDQHRVGIFKKEFQGCKMISLCSKSYIYCNIYTYIQVYISLLFLSNSQYNVYSTV